MPLQRNRCYLFAAGLLLLGYGWILYLKMSHNNKALSSVGLCIFKQTTGIPCPSCGSSRSVLAITRGQFTEAFLWNPLGYMIAAVLLILPFVILYDLAYQQKVLIHIYERIENLFRKRVILFSAITLIIANWIWNIYKAV
jgi:hypothetical protein